MAEKRKTQRERVLDYISEFGSITSLEAFRDLGVTRLSAVVFDLKKAGVNIRTTMRQGKNRFGDTTHFAQYDIEEEENS